MFGFLSPPEIPEPVKPDDFTKQERDRLRSVVTEGDPLRTRRDQTGIDRLLTNAVTEITGPTGAFTLSQRQHANDQVGRDIAEFLGQSSQLEEERRYQSEDRLGQLESQRNRDLDEYDQMVQAHQAAEEVARKNWQSGLLRAGAGLLSVAAPGIGSIVGAAATANQASTPQAGVGFSQMSGEAMGRMANSVEPVGGTVGMTNQWEREDESMMPGASGAVSPSTLARPSYNEVFGIGQTYNY